MKNLNSSKTLAQYTSQFVTIKLAGDETEWRGYRQDLMSNQSITYPYMLIVRSDREKIFDGSVGKATVPQVAKVLHAALSTAGQQLTEKDVNLLIETKQIMETALESSHDADAISALLKVKNLSNEGLVPSYASSAQELNKITKGLVEKGGSKLAAVKSLLESEKYATEDEQLQLLKEYADFLQKYGKLKSLKSELTEVKGLIRKADLRQSEKIVSTVLKYQDATDEKDIEVSIGKIQRAVEDQPPGPILDFANQVIARLQNPGAQQDGEDAATKDSTAKSGLMELP